MITIGGFDGLYGERSFLHMLGCFGEGWFFVLNRFIDFMSVYAAGTLLTEKDKTNKKHAGFLYKSMEFQSVKAIYKWHNTRS